VSPVTDYAPFNKAFPPTSDADKFQSMKMIDKGFGIVTQSDMKRKCYCCLLMTVLLILTCLIAFGPLDTVWRKE